MKRVVYIFLLISSSTFGQDNLDFLEIDTVHDLHSIRLMRFNEKLLQGLNKRAILQYQSFPSREPEYILILQNSDSEYSLTYRSFTENFFGSKNKDTISIVTKTRIIEPDLAEALKILFVKALAKREKRNSITFDGQTYHFSVNNGEDKFTLGKTISPESGSRVGDLVELCEKIRVIVDNNFEFHNKLLLDTKQLSKRFE